MPGPMKLDFSNVELAGRDSELAVLRKALDEASIDTKPKSTSVFIEGSSGSGKTALVETFRKATSERCIFCKGKFDEQRASSEPFSAIDHAMNELVSKLLESVDKEEWRERMEGALKEDLCLLSTFIPRLKELVGNRSFSTDDERRAPSEIDNKEGLGFERLRFALRDFVRMVSTSCALVVFIDDLQWAKSDSLALIETLLEDAKPRRFVFIGAHRPVERPHILLEFKQKIRSSKKLDIYLSELTANSVALILSSLLRRNAEDVKELAEVAHRKTGGNAFFVVQFIGLLEQEDLLSYSVQTYRWEWGVERIKSQTDVVSDSVVELLIGKIQGLPMEQQTILTAAAYLGTTYFDILTLRQIVLSSDVSTAVLSITKNEEKSPELLRDKENFSKALCEVVDKGFLERMAETKFKFAHDRIREAAYLLFADDSARIETHLRIGKRMREMLSDALEEGKAEKVQERLLLQAVSQLNIASDLLLEEERRELAELNHRAANLAQQRSAFYPATDFLERGIRLLGDDPWSESFGLMLQLSIALTRVYYCTGRLGDSLTTAERVLEKAKSFSDKRGCYHIKIFCLMQQGKRYEALDVALSVLSELGIHLPRRFLKFHIVKELLRTRRSLRGRTGEELLALRRDDNPVADDQHEFMERTAEIALSSGFPDYLALLLILAVRMTVENGANIQTAMTFTTWGWFLASQGSFDEGLRYGEIGMHYAKQHTRQDLRATIIFYTFVRHWRCPIHEGLEPLYKSIQGLWEAGDIETVFPVTPHYFMHYFSCGLALEPLESDMRRCMELMKDFHQNQFYDLWVPCIQMIANIMTDEPVQATELTGEYMNEHELIQKCRKSGNTIGLNSVCWCKMILAYTFHEFELAARMAKKVRVLDVEGPNITIPLRQFFKGMIALQLARSKLSWWHRRQGNRVVRHFEKLVKDGCINCHHMLLLLQAEQLSVSSKDLDSVRKAYDDAISAAARLGLQQRQALANERAGIYFLQKDDRTWATTYLCRARELYEVWGARSKVKHLSGKYKELFDTSLETTSGMDARASHLQARTRLDDFSSGRLKQLRDSQEFGIIGASQSETPS